MALFDVEMFLPFAGRLEPELVGLLVTLGAGTTDAGSLGGVQHPELDSGGVGVDAHLAAQRIDLADDLSLGQAADGGVAGHLTDGVEVHRQQQRLATHTCRSQGRLDPGMAGADHNHVINFGILEHEASLP